MFLSCTVAALGLSMLAQEYGVVTRTVRAKVQPRPGAAEVDHDMPVRLVPVDPPLVSASNSSLAPDDLVLGLELDGAAVAYPISTLANFEVVNSLFGELPVAPTW